MNICRIIFTIFVLLVFSQVSFSQEQESPWIQRYIEVIATAYCPKKCCCGEFANGKTATGRDAYTKGVAVDRSIIPLGSRLDIPNYGNWILADDVGGAIKKNRIDVRFNTHEEALEWGIKKLKIRVWTKK